MTKSSGRSRRSVANAILIAMGLGIGGSAPPLYRWLGAAHTPDVDEPADLTCADDQLDLGERGEGDLVSRTFQITNNVGRSVTIVNTSGSCDVSLSDPPLPRALAAGESLSIEGVFTISPNSPCQQGRVTELSIPVTVQAVADGERIDRTYQFRARLIRNLTTPPGGVAIGMVHEGAIPGHRRLVKLPVSERVDRVECDGLPNWSVVVSNPVRGEAGLDYVEVILVMRGELRPGVFHERFKFVPIGPAGKRLPAVELDVHGEVVADVVTLPRDLLHVGRWQVGATVEEAVQLVAPDPAMLHDIRASVVGSTGAASIVREPNRQVTIVVRLPILREGQQDITLDIQAIDQAGRTRRVPVILRYVGYRAAPPM